MRRAYAYFSARTGSSVDTDSYTNDYSYSNSDVYSYEFYDNSDANGHIDSRTNGYSHNNSDTYPYDHSDANGHIDSYANDHSDANGDAHSDAEPDSSLLECHRDSRVRL